MVIKLIRPMLVCLLVAGCTLPRGAAIQSEVLREQDAENPSIAVYPVTRALLPRFANWPYTGTSIRSDGWLKGGGGAGSQLIKPYDRVDLVVWDSEDNSLLTSEGQKLVEMRNMRVNGNGQIFVPYLGEQRISGKTPDAARRQLERAMIEIVPSAQVQIAIMTSTQSVVSLVGGVNAPGTVPLPEGKFTVLNLIAQGGGPQATLRNPRVRLIRGGHTYATSLQRLYDNPSLDTSLTGGDKVALVSDDRYFRSLGASGAEQIFYFDKEHISALDAVSMFGGLSDQRANPKGVLVLRNYGSGAVRPDGIAGPENARTVFTIDLTTADGLFSAEKFAIHPQDTVLVTESPVTSARTVFSIVGSAFGVANQL
ncbi:polysaccharide biosynthesis/export family protein [Vannielia sp.]|uniref:polysaccharide biosynthesis/export family protein n=1 Tax=Vannielia sp. TaxID=2813045 RepID=UPI0026088886|nr:polysaccharide biosynthesis/export family protein [Vannielia sp.]